MGMLDSQWYPGNLYLINIIEDIVVFSDFRVFHTGDSYIFPCSRNAQLAFIEKIQSKIISFQIKKINIEI